MRSLLTAILVVAVVSPAFGSMLLTGGTINGAEGATLRSVGVVTFSDSALDPLSNYAATIDWGDGSALSPGFALQISGTLFEVLGTHTYFEEGAYSPHVTVFDLDGDSASALATALISDAPLTPGTVSPLLFIPGEVNNANVAQFVDENPSGVVTDFAAGIDWGDGTSSPGTIQVVSGTRFGVYGSHTYSSPGDFTITTSVFDLGGATVAVQTQATVVPEPASVSLCLAGLLGFSVAVRRRCW
jgi:hypothetical protein